MARLEYQRGLFCSARRLLETIRSIRTRVCIFKQKKKKRRKEEAFLQNQEETSIRFAYRILANYTDVQPIFSSHGLMKCEDNPIPIYMYIHIIYMYVYTYYIIYAHAKHKILRLSIYNHVITRAHVRMSSYT